MEIFIYLNNKLITYKIILREFKNTNNFLGSIEIFVNKFYKYYISNKFFGIIINIKVFIKLIINYD